MSNVKILCFIAALVTNVLMAYSDTSDEEVDLNNPNLDAALHQAEQLLGIPPEQARYVGIQYVTGCQFALPP